MNQDFIENRFILVLLLYFGSGGGVSWMRNVIQRKLFIIFCAVASTYSVRETIEYLYLKAKTDLDACINERNEISC